MASPLLLSCLSHFSPPPFLLQHPDFSTFPYLLRKKKQITLHLSSPPPSLNEVPPFSHLFTLFLSIVLSLPSTIDRYPFACPYLLSSTFLLLPSLIFLLLLFSRWFRRFGAITRGHVLPAGWRRSRGHAFMAPEVIQCWGFGKPVYMWACGVLLFLLLGGSLPFMGMRDQLYEQIVQGRSVFD